MTERHVRGPLRAARLRPRLSRSGVSVLLAAAALGAALVVELTVGRPAPDPVATRQAPDEPREPAGVGGAPAPERQADEPASAPEPAQDRRAAAEPPRPEPALPAPPPVTRALPAEEVAPAPPSAAQAGRAADEAERAANLAEGERLLALGDLAAARLFFRHVAEAGDPRGAEAMARSYDPATLAGLPVHGLAADPVAAQRWREAARSGGAAAP